MIFAKVKCCESSQRAPHSTKWQISCICQRLGLFSGFHPEKNISVWFSAVKTREPDGCIKLSGSLCSVGAAGCWERFWEQGLACKSVSASYCVTFWQFNEDRDFSSHGSMLYPEHMPESQWLEGCLDAGGLWLIVCIYHSLLLCSVFEEFTLYHFICSL